jgi:hypothetical protein
MTEKLPGEPNARDRMAVQWCKDGVPMGEIARKLRYKGAHHAETRIRWAIEWAFRQAAEFRREGEL